MDPNTWFRILVAVALADGQLDPGEWRVLLRCAAWLGLTRPRAGELLREVRARGPGVVARDVPSTQRLQLYRAVLQVVLADGRVSHAEAACLCSLAAHFGIDPESARQMFAEAALGWEDAIARHAPQEAADPGEGDAADSRGSRAPTVTSSEGCATDTADGPGPSPQGARGRPSTARVLAAIPAAPLTPGTRVGGKFRVLEALGQGGCGAVFRARHEDLDEDVALKVLRPGVLALRPNAELRFLREVRLARRVNHRYAVPLREFGRDPRHGLFFTMDLVPGRTISDLLDDEEQLPLERAAPLVIQVLEALEEAHRVGIVHRDLKPANLMVTSGSDGAEEVRVLDFGVAKAFSSAAAPDDLALTREGALVGTPTYMSPEQALRRELDPRSDVYSLAVVLYECLCGCLPYTIDPEGGDVQGAVFLQVLATPARDPRELVPSLPEPVAQVLLCALAKERELRFPDARAFRSALVDALLPRGRRAKSPSGRIDTWLRRWREAD